jgi:phenylacetic acid degradation operon negative regulatory protein
MPDTAPSTNEPAAAPGERPLTARSVIASNLLGMANPALPARLLVRAGELFGITEGTTRVALSRMVASSELVVEDGVYRLSGRLLERQHEQEAGRHPDLRPWDGGWRIGLVRESSRAPAARAELRTAMSRLRLAELREGVWVRPDNLDPAYPIGQSASARAARTQCRWLTGHLDDDDANTLAASLWAVGDWSARAELLIARMSATSGDLECGDMSVLAPCFVLSAAVVRHIRSDPLLPPELLPRSWPGRRLRLAYDRYEAAYTRLLRAWLRQSTTSGSGR